MEKKIQITVCMGSSCFARGNNGLPKLVREFLVRKGVLERVSFKGQHCTSNCSKGPVVIVGNDVIEGVGLANFAELIDAKLEKYL